LLLNHPPGNFCRPFAVTLIQLRSHIITLVSEHPSSDAIRTFVSLCHKMATLYLNRKLRGGRPHPELISLPSIALQTFSGVTKTIDSRSFVPTMVRST
jgi:hypothetical protein